MRDHWPCARRLTASTCASKSSRSMAFSIGAAVGMGPFCHATCVLAALAAVVALHEQIAMRDLGAHCLVEQLRLAREEFVDPSWVFEEGVEDPCGIALQAVEHPAPDRLGELGTHIIRIERPEGRVDRSTEQPDARSKAERGSGSV